MSRRGMLSGWVLATKTWGQSNPIKIPWHWTFALALERRWEYVSEVSAMYGDEEAGGDFEKVPPEYWHDMKRVNEWVDKMKERKREKREVSY